MTSKGPEQQPTPELGKSPTDMELDIDAAKKYLDEVYDSEKSSDRSMPILEKQEKENEKEPDIEKPKPDVEEDSLKGTEKEEPTTEKLTEEGKVKTANFELTDLSNKSKEEQEKESENEPEVEEPKPEEKLTEREKVEVAKNRLIELAGYINEAEKEKDEERKTSLYDKAKEVFEVATGKSLDETAKEKAKIEAESEGLKVVTPEEYRKEKTAEAQERIRQKERSAIIRERWDMLSDKEKAKYFSEGKDKNDIANINSARIKFATELKGKIDAKRQELSKGKKGIVISEDVFYELMKKGLKSEDIKKRGFFGRMFGDEIKIPPLDKRGSLEMTKEDLKAMEAKVKKNIEDSAREEVERKIIEGQKKWRAKKQRHTREIIQNIATDYELEKELQIKPEKESEKKPEITEELKPFNRPSDIEKLMKKVNSDIETKDRQLEKIQKLHEKIKQGKTLASKEIEFLNKVDSAYRKEERK